MSQLTELFTNIANAIRSKTGESEQIQASNFPTSISNIPVGSTYIGRSAVTAGSTQTALAALPEKFADAKILLCIAESKLSLDTTPRLPVASWSSETQPDALAIYLNNGDFTTGVYGGTTITYAPESRVISIPLTNLKFFSSVYVVYGWK